MSTENDDINFIFVLGIMPRSGTHYLRNLLCLHPQCFESAISEDSLVDNSNILVKYVAQNYQKWEVDGDLPSMQADELLINEIGNGLLNFLKRARYSAVERHLLPQPMPDSENNPQYLVAKTPSVRNIKNFFRLFPDEKLLILVRDGRSLVESMNLSFGHSREKATRDWANAARDIFDMQKKWEAEGRQFLIVKYEELYLNTEQEMKNIFGFLGLDSAKYDFDEAMNLPVVGSSVFKRNGGDVHWQPVGKTPEFNPIIRSAEWKRWQHERFNWLASNELVLLGYEPVQFSQGNPWIGLRNRACDFAYAVRLWSGRFRKLTYFIVKRLKLHFNNSNKRNT